MKDRLVRKKYMGVWSRMSLVMIRMMSRFFSFVIRYMFRKSINRSCCCLGFFERFRSRNLEI